MKGQDLADLINHSIGKRDALRMDAFLQFKLENGQQNNTTQEV